MKKGKKIDMKDIIKLVEGMYKHLTLNTTQTKEQMTRDVEFIVTYNQAVRDIVKKIKEL